MGGCFEIKLGARWIAQHGGAELPDDSVILGALPCIVKISLLAIALFVLGTNFRLILV